MQGARKWEAAEQNSKGQPHPRRSGQEGLTAEAGGGGGGICSRGTCYFR